MEEPLFKQHFTLPIKSMFNYSKVFDDNNQLMFDFMSDWMSGIVIQKVYSLSNEQRQQVIDILNCEKQSKLFEKGYFVNHKDGVILLNIKDVQYAIMLIRGWGYLTGINGLNLSPEKATEIQESLADYICQKLNFNPIKQ